MDTARVFVAYRQTALPSSQGRAECHTRSTDRTSPAQTWGIPASQTDLHLCNRAAGERVAHEMSALHAMYPLL